MVDKYNIRLLARYIIHNRKTDTYPYNVVNFICSLFVAIIITLPLFYKIVNCPILNLYLLYFC